MISLWTAEDMMAASLESLMLTVVTCGKLKISDVIIFKGSLRLKSFILTVTSHTQDGERRNQSDVRLLQRDEEQVGQTVHKTSMKNKQKYCESESSKILNKTEKQFLF